MNDPNQDKKPVMRERRQASSRVRFSMDNAQSKSSQLAAAEIISPQSAIEQLKTQCPALELSETVSSVHSISRSRFRILSYRHLPPKWQIARLTFEEVNNQLTHFLDNNIVPIITIRDNVTFEANEIYKPLCDHLTHYVYNSPALRSYENIQRIRRLIHRLFDVIQRRNPDKQLTYTLLDYLKLFPEPRMNGASALTLNPPTQGGEAKSMLP